MISDYFFHYNYEILNILIKLCVVVLYTSRPENTNSLLIIGVRND